MDGVENIVDSALASAPRSSIDGEQMRMVLEMSRVLVARADLDSLLKEIADICRELLDCEVASIFLYDGKTAELWSKVVMRSREIRIPAASGIVGHAFTSNKLIHVPAPYDDPRFNRGPDLANGFVTRNLLACPMPDIHGRPLGVVEGINKRGRGFDQSDFGLVRLFAEQAAVAVQRHYYQQEALAAQSLRTEMELARKVQLALLPKAPPTIDGLSAVGWTLPASGPGGDCFDLWKTCDGRLGILVADASGHGLAPALIVSQTRTLVRAISEIESNPHLLLAHANKRLCADLADGRFVTAFVAFVSSDGTMAWSSAGHGPVFMRPHCSQPLQTLDPPSMPLGVHDRWLGEAPPGVQLKPSGSLLLVSDGIFEAPNAAGERYSVDRLIDLFDLHRDAAPDFLASTLRHAISQWQALHDPLDDQTVVIMQRDKI